MLVPSALVGDGGVLEQPTVLRLPTLTATVPFATAVYNSSGFHVSYTIQLRHELHDVTWQTTHRYSSFRNFYRKINKRPFKLDFPPLLFTSKANRSKDEVETRRKKLEDFMRDVTGRCLGNPGCSDQEVVLRILKFIDYPFMDEFVTTAHLSVDYTDDDDDDDVSCASDIAPSPSSSAPHQTTSPYSELVMDSEDDVSSNAGSSSSAGSSASLHTPMPVPMIVTTRWRAPALLPAMNIGLSLPYVNIGRDVTGVWAADVRGERIARKGLMQQRYDEAVSMSAKLNESARLLDAAEAQQHLQAFRRAHPLTWYLRKERDSQTALRDDGTAPPTSSSQYSSSNSTSRLRSNDLTDSEATLSDVGSPTVHHHRALPSGPTVTVRSAGGESSGKPRAPSPVEHYHLDIDHLTRTTPVSGCKCDQKTYCSTEKGDTYVLPRSGFTIFVVPPKTAGNA